MGSDPDLLYGIILIIWIHTIWRIFLFWEQNAVTSQTTTVPEELEEIMTERSLSEAQLYTLDMLKLEVINSFLETVAETAVVLLYILAFFWTCSTQLAKFIGMQHDEIMVLIIFIIILRTLKILIWLPVNTYYNLVVAKRYGLIKHASVLSYLIKTCFLYVLEVMKIMLLVPIVMIIYWEFGGQYFIIHLWLLRVLYAILYEVVIKNVISSAWNDFKPLEDGQLKILLEDLASDVNFPLSEIYVYEASKVTTLTTAYIYGFWNDKKIVLYDKLMDILSNKEIVAVMAHELGHWQENHVLKFSMYTQAYYLFLYLLAGILFQYKFIWEAFKFYESRPLLIIFCYVLIPCQYAFSFCCNLLQRYFEYKADEFAVSLGLGGYLRLALIKLDKNNLVFPVWYWLYSIFMFDHPTLLERLERLPE